MRFHFSKLIPDWRLVRGVGQLQLLNRASLFMIIFVPILTSLWTVVIRWLGWTEGRPTLPESWALLFFASLATLIARTVFQLRCPDVVKYRGIDEFIRDKKREYAEAPSASAVTQAIEHLRQLNKGSGLIEEEERVEIEVYDRRQELKKELDRTLDEIDRLNAERNNTATHFDNFGRLRDLEDQASARRRELNALVERDRGDRGPDFRRRMALVELSAEHFYLRQAKIARLSMFFCGLAYVVAIALIIKVTVEQAQAVARAAGWI